MKTKRIKTLSDVRRFLNGLSWINHGGCGIAALAMYRWLEKNNKLTGKTTIVYLYDNTDEDRFDLNYRILETNNNKITPQSCAHIGLKHRGKLVDSEGIIVDECGEFLWETETNNQEFVVKSLNNIPAWNNLFNRNQIKDIEKVLEIDLSDVRIK